MANSVKVGNTWISLVLDSNWISGFHNFASCKFSPFTAGDKLVIQEYPVDYGTTTQATSTWPKLVLKSIAGEPIECFFKGKRKTKLYIPYSECVFSTPASVNITFEVF